MPNCIFFVLVFLFYRKVEYLNAKGSFLDPHTIKAVLNNGTEVKTTSVFFFIFSITSSLRVVMLYGI